MTARVGLYSHSGLTTPPISGSNGKLSTDSLFLLKQPRLAGEVLTATTGAAVTSSTATAPDGTKLLRIEVEPGARIYYEVSPGADLREATADSAIIEGSTQIEFGPSWRISVLLVS